MQGQKGPDQPVSGGTDRDGPSDAGSRWHTRDESPVRTVAVGAGLGATGILLPLLVIGGLSSIILSLDLPGTSFIAGFLILGQFALFVVVGLAYLRWRSLGWGEIRSYLGIERPSAKDIAMILGIWIVVIVVAMITASIVTTVLPELLGVENDPSPAENPVSTTIQENPGLVGIAILGMFLVVGPAEEVLFRGVIQNRLRERLSAIPGVVVASAVFALAHLIAFVGQDPVGIAMTITILFVPGLGLGAIYEYTGNIVVPSLLHGFHNSMIVLAIYATTVYDVNQEAAAVLPAVLGHIPV